MPEADELFGVHVVTEGQQVDQRGSMGLVAIGQDAISSGRDVGLGSGFDGGYYEFQRHIFRQDCGAAGQFPGVSPVWLALIATGTELVPTVSLPARELPSALSVPS